MTRIEFIEFLIEFRKDSGLGGISACMVGLKGNPAHSLQATGLDYAPASPQPEIQTSTQFIELSLSLGV